MNGPAGFWIGLFFMICVAAWIEEVEKPKMLLDTTARCAIQETPGD